MILQSRKTSRIVKVNVEGQIVNVRTTSGMDGAPTLDVDLNDPEWLITNLDILDLDTNGKLDHVETEFKDEWFRLVKVSPSNEQLGLTFEHRVVSILRKYKKTKKHRRVPGYTRAMFIKSLVDEARHDGNDIRFYCPRLHEQEAIAKNKPQREPVDQTGVKGFSKGAKLTVKGKTATKKQKQVAAQALRVADSYVSNLGSGVRWRVYMALMEALITESRITNLSGGDADSGGVLQVRRGIHRNVTVTDVEQVVALFLTKGFAGRGGAVSLASTTTLRPHQIAQAVQGSAFADGSNYREWEAEASAWVKAYHAITDPNDLSQDAVVDQAYYFTRGEAGVPEDSWTAMNRLASEVRWRVFVKGNTVYYLPDADLYTQRPVAVFNRLSPRVIDSSFDWDEGKPVHELNLTVQRQDLKHGATIETTDFGPASGRWLVWEVQTERTGGFSNLLCRTPQAAKKEPAPEQQSVTIEGKAGTKRADAFQTLLAACKAVDRNTPGYLYGGGHGPDLDDLGPKTRFDCSSSTSWVLHKAGMFPHPKAWVSGDFARKYGRPGKGRLFTVWANEVHVWIEFHTGPFARFDTGGPRTTSVSVNKQFGGPAESTQVTRTLGSGAHLSKQRRSTAGFTPRHFEGM